MIAVALAVVMFILAVGAVAVAYRRQWHVRARAQIRRLPEHRGHRERV